MDLSCNWPSFLEDMQSAHLLTAEQAWSRLVSAVHDHAPVGRTTTITHDRLMNNPKGTAN
jgi:hypothetical protein